MAVGVLNADCLLLFHEAVSAAKVLEKVWSDGIIMYSSMARI
jgi:hypothetical protein